MASPPTSSKTSKRRFKLRHSLGAGAYGEVYLAEDLERGGQVALKSLHRAEPTALAQFKREFRALTDIAHPNLAQLYELFAEKDRWYFTMEYIDGVHFLEHIWSQNREQRRHPSTSTGTILDIERVPSGSADQSGTRGSRSFLEDSADQSGAEDTRGGSRSILDEPEPSSRPASESRRGSRSILDDATLDQHDSAAPQALTPPSSILDDATLDQEDSAIPRSISDRLKPPEPRPSDSPIFIETGNEPQGSVDVPPESSVDIPRPPSEPGAFDSGPAIAPAQPDAPPSKVEATPSIDALFLERLASSFVQLTRGVRALHATRRLHRDLKPSNVLADQDGRIIILDFGLVLELENAGPQGRKNLTGTPAYMAPEQVEKDALDGRADWYAVGVMLYQALTGRLPFEGTTQQVLALKTAVAPPPVRQHNPQVPEGLARLCERLLARKTEDRATGQDILAFFEAEDRENEEGGFPFVARDKELAALRACFKDFREQGGLIAGVQGRSGMGKSALAEVFLDGLEAARQAFILRGRCYQQESVPYKVWDPIVDALAAFLSGLPEEEVLALTPTEPACLVRIFPTLKQVRRFAAVGQPGIPDPQEIQRRAFVGMKALLQNLAERRPLVLYVDDLQWGDLDSARLLERVLAEPRPPLLFLATYRSEEIETSPMLASFLGIDAPRRSVEVEGLSATELGELRQALGVAAETDLEALARDSGGSPYFAGELLRKAASDKAEGASLQLDELIIERVSELPPTPRTLLELIAVAAHPLPISAASQIVEDGLQGAIVSLRSAHFIRGRGEGKDETLECYHDRIRESVTAALHPDRKQQLHAELATALEALGEEDLELLAVHFRAAGAKDKARTYAIQAAERASEALAFDNAARLYEAALEDNDDNELRIKLGESLTNARRWLEAARVYLVAAEKVDAERAIEFRTRAAFHFFYSGHHEEGMQTAREVLKVVGMRLPNYNPLDLMAMGARGLRYRMRPIKYTLRPESEVPERQLRIVDACWSLTSSMNAVDIIATIDFNHRMMMAALDAGEPKRLARAFASHAYLLVNLFRVGRRAQIRRSKWLMDQARSIAEAEGDPAILGMVHMIAAAAAFTQGYFHRGLGQAQTSIDLLRERCVGVTFELDNAYAIKHWCLTYLGEARQIVDELPEQADEADKRNNLYALLMLGGINLNWYYMFRDAVDEGEPIVLSRLERCRAGIGRDAGFHLWSDFITQADRALYRGDGPGAWSVVDDQWWGLVKNQVLEVQMTRITCLDTMGRCALSAARQSKTPSDKRRWLKKARKAAKRLAKEIAVHGPAFGRLLENQAALLDGREDLRFRLIIDSERRFQEFNMPLHAQVCRWHRGRQMGERGFGDELFQEADQWMRQRGIQNPERIAGLLAPGFVQP